MDREALQVITAEVKPLMCLLIRGLRRGKTYAVCKVQKATKTLQLRRLYTSYISTRHLRKLVVILSTCSVAPLSNSFVPIV
jgi:hypothetical protein